MPATPALPRRALSDGADRLLSARYVADDGAAVNMVVALCASHGEGRELVGFGTGLLRENGRWARVDDLPQSDGRTAMRIIAVRLDGAVERVVATWYRVGDVLTSDPARVKPEIARASLPGGRQCAPPAPLGARAVGRADGA